MWNENNGYEGLVMDYSIPHIQIGEVIRRNGVLILNGYAVDEEDSIVVGNAVIQDLKETVNRYVCEYMGCIKYTSLEGYIKRIKYLEKFEHIPSETDAYKALDKFYNLIEESIKNKCSSINNEKTKQKTPESAENEDDIVF